MIKRLFSYAVFVFLVIVVFNLFDFIFDRFIAHGAYTFDSLSNIILPVLIAVLVIAFLALYRKFVK